MKQIHEQEPNFKELKQKWLDEIKTIDTKAKLNRYVDKVMYGYEHDFGTYIHALAVCVKAFIKVHGKRLSDLQVDFLMFEIIREVFGKKDPIAIKLVQFGWLLYPQSVYKCEFRITKEAHNRIIDCAKQLLLTDKTAEKVVRDHWEKLASGWLPKFVIIEETGEKA